jgi:tRNA1(Val) A37 N6-methylase TrmN6
MDETALRHNDASVTIDRLLGGKIVVAQPAKGYRAGLDALLLAAACEAAEGERVIEAGCGVGGALLCAARLNPGARFTGLERDGEAAALAQANAARNDLSERVEIVEGDVARPFAKLGLPPFDAALCNPPFFDDPQALRAPDPAKQGAWMADDGLGAWIGFLGKALREGGRLTMIHRADRLGDMLALLQPKFGSVQARPVQPFADAPAKRVLVRAVKTGKAPLQLLPPLVLHRRGEAGMSPEADALMRGEAALPWL